MEIVAGANGLLKQVGVMQSKQKVAEVLILKAVIHVYE